MVKEVSIGAIVYKKDKKIKYLLLYRSVSEHYKEMWGFPKGHIEKGETQQQAAEREIEEEAGLTSLRFEEGFRKKINYFFRKEGQTIFKEVVYFLAELTDGQEVKINDEHDEFKWLSYDDAMKTLTYDNAKKILEEADKFLKESKKQKTLGEF